MSAMKTIIHCTNRKYTLINAFTAVSWLAVYNFNIQKCIPKWINEMKINRIKG